MSTQPPRPGPPEAEELIGRAVAQRLEPLYAQMANLTRSIGRLDERLARPAGPGPESTLAARVDGLAARLQELAPLPGAVAALEHSVQQQLAPRLTALAGLLQHSAAPLDLRQSVASVLDQAVTRMEAARATDSARLTEEVAALVSRAEADAERRDEQARLLLAAVDDRLRVLLEAGIDGGDGGERRLAARLEAVAAEQGRALLARIDERTSAATGLEIIRPQLAAEINLAVAAAVTSQVEPLVNRVADAVEAIYREGGRSDAVARGHTGEAKAVEDRVAAMFVEVAERVEAATDRSRGRLSEGQVALAARFDTIIGELLRVLGTTSEGLEARVAARLDELKAGLGHQNAALLDAVNRGSQQMAEGMAEVRSTVAATGTEWIAGRAEADKRSERLEEALQGVRVAVESLRSDSGLEALRVEQVAARDAQLAAIEAVSGRVGEVGPLVARALLAEVQRATRAAHAAEEAVSALDPEGLRSVLAGSSRQAADEVLAMGRRLDETILALAEQLDRRLEALAEREAAASGEVGALQRSAAERTAGRLDEMESSLRAVLGRLAEAAAAGRDDLLGLTTRALEQADEVAAVNAAVVADLRASQAALRDAIQDGAHQAALAAADLRGLRDRLNPHLAALAEATSRRADADQAGFDAVLARLDQLIADRRA